MIGPGSHLDTYELIEHLGSGGMGDVWLATDRRLHRKVALKVLAADVTRDPTRIERFEREARSASALNHPNVCTIFALGDVDDVQRYIAMEYIEGETLRKRIAAGPLAIDDALDIAIQIASALSAAHASGIVHRDIKPENVIRRPDGVVKVLDFGLAKLTGAPESDPDSTRTKFGTTVGSIVGTTAYMSPEQARAQEVDARTDIWALGALLYEMVAGRPPFDGETSSDVMAAILERDPPVLSRFEPNVPPELQRIVTKALRKDRNQRYQTTADFLLDLRALREDSRTAGTSTRRAASADAGTSEFVPEAAWRTSSVKRRAALALAVGVLIAGVTLARWWQTAPGPASGESASTGSVQRPITRLTFGTGLQTGATFSPDGQFVAYASDRAGNFDIWVQPVAGGDPVQVTTSDANELQPDWSPDGGTIAYWSAASATHGAGIFLVPALGGLSRRLTTFGIRPRWSPDGARIAFLSAEPFPAGGIQPDVFVTAIAGGSPQEALGPARKAIKLLFSVAWHPDGRLSILGLKSGLFGPRMVPVLFTLGPHGTKVDETTLDALPVGRTELYDPPYRGAWWSPSGRDLYVEADVNRVRTIFRVPIDPSTLRAGSAERLTSSVTNDTAGAMSRNGKRLAFTAQRDTFRLRIMPFDAVRGRVLDAGEPIGDPDTVPGTPDLSNDQKQVAYVLARPGSERFELWTWDIERARGTQLTADGLGRATPRWSPDGQRLAYARATSATGDRWQIVIREGDSEQVVTQPSVSFVWQWPTGNTLVGSELLPDGRVALVTWRVGDTPNARPQILAKSPQLNLFQGQLSPNGRWMAFCGYATEGAGLAAVYLMPSTGSPPESWAKVNIEGISDKPRWSQDGQTLYFVSNAGSSYFNLWGVRIDDERGTPIGTPFQVTRFNDPTLVMSPRLHEADISVGAKRLLLLMRESAGNIWMLENVDQ